MEVYDIRQQPSTNDAAFTAKKKPRLDWQFSGVGNSQAALPCKPSALRTSITGGLEVYNINNNKLTGAAFIGPTVWIGR